MIRQLLRRLFGKVPQGNRVRLPTGESVPRHRAELCPDQGRSGEFDLPLSGGQSDDEEFYESPGDAIGARHDVWY